MARMRDTKTGDLFKPNEVFGVPETKDMATAVDFNRRTSQLVSMALKRSPLERYEIAAHMSEALGETITKNMLDAYASGGRLDQNITLVRFKALVRATGQTWLWQEILEDEGVTILVGDEVRLAQLGLYETRKRELEVEIKRLKSLPSPAITSRGAQ